MKITTDFIRAAVEGKTADGREITAQQLQQMAESYDPNVYAAHIWPEHIRGVTADSIFKSLGDVAEVKAESIKGGQLDGKLALYVKLQPHPELVNMVRNGQKVHLSVEIHPKFPTTGGAYLMGLGVTDSPASLGTGIMSFSASSRTESLFSTPEPVSSAITPEESSKPEAFILLIEQFRKERDSLHTEIHQYKQQLAAKDAEIADLKNQIPAQGYTPRPLQTGQESGNATGWL
jgi:hypothetical protein